MSDVSPATVIALAAAAMALLAYAAVLFSRMPACQLGDVHRPQRHPLGGFTCADCGLTGATLSEFGFDESGDFISDQQVSIGGAPGERFIERRAR